MSFSNLIPHPEFPYSEECRPKSKINTYSEAMTKKLYEVNQELLKERWAILHTHFIHLVQPHMASRVLACHTHESALIYNPV